MNFANELRTGSGSNRFRWNHLAWWFRTGLERKCTWSIYRIIDYRFQIIDCRFRTINNRSFKANMRANNRQSIFRNRQSIIRNRQSIIRKSIIDYSEIDNRLFGIDNRLFEIDNSNANFVAFGVPYQCGYCAGNCCQAVRKRRDKTVEEIL